MPGSRTTQIAALKQSIVALEEQQRSSGVDLRSSIQPLRELLAQLAQSASSGTAASSGAGASRSKAACD